jgi:hypothetical protein
LTDEELRQYLKPKTNWREIVLFVIALAGGAAALGKWVFTAPTQADYQGHDVRLKSVEQDHAVLRATVDGLRMDVAKQDAHFDKIEIKLDKLIDRRR